MTIQSQLDQVLAPCPFCGTSGPRHCTTKDEHGRPSYGVQCVSSECAIIGPQVGSPREAAEKWNRQHGPAIRAAVGGEAVAVVEQTAPEGLYARFIGAGRIYTVTPGAILYASPTANVDVGALRELVEKWREAEKKQGDAYQRTSSSLSVDWQAYGSALTYDACADELAALIDGAGNG